MDGIIQIQTAPAVWYRLIRPETICDPPPISAALQASVMRGGHYRSLRLTFSMSPATAAAEECLELELLADLVEAPTFLEEELGRNPISVGRAVLWLASCAGDCAACSLLLSGGMALVSLAQPTNDRVPSQTKGTDNDGCGVVGDNAGVGAGRDSGRWRWLPATVLALPRQYTSGTRAKLLNRDGSKRVAPSSCAVPLPLAAPASNDDESRSLSLSDRHCPCSALLSPCLEEGLGLHPPTTNSGCSTGRTGGEETPPPVALRRLTVRALPTSPIALASAVELSGPYPVSTATCRPDIFGGHSGGGQDSQAAQPPAQLTAAMASVLPCALDGEVLAEGSVCCVAGLFAMVVAKVWAEEGRQGRGRKEDDGVGVEQRPSHRSTETLVVRVHGATELRLSSPLPGSATQRGRDEEFGRARGAGARGDRQPPSHDRNDNVAAGSARATAPAETQTKASSGRCSPGPSPAPPPSCFPDSREWIQRVGRDFGGLGDQVACAVTSVGTALRGGGGGSGGFLTAPASGLLLHGPTGVGKTLLVR